MLCVQQLVVLSHVFRLKMYPSQRWSIYHHTIPDTNYLLGPPSPGREQSFQIPKAGFAIPLPGHHVGTWNESFLKLLNQIPQDPIGQSQTKKERGHLDFFGLVCLCIAGLDLLNGDQMILSEIHIS